MPFCHDVFICCNDCVNVQNKVYGHAVRAGGRYHAGRATNELT